METIYRKVAVSKRLPETRKILFILHDVDKWESTGYIDKKGRFFNDWDEDVIECYPSHWLEEIDESQLQKEKEELVEMLECILPMFTELDSQFGIENPPERQWDETEIATIQSISNYLEKHSQ